jgi:endonuclease/exonuclease/phosphatase (EEP) superfamily protein YafD
VTTLGCDAAIRALRDAGAGNAAAALDRSPFRLLDWNVHKQADPGWDRDLAEFAASSDVVLLQEAVLQPPLLRILDDAGLRWLMASSFIFRDEEFGVLTATRIAPIASCTQRAMEPLIRIPKSSVISWLPMANTAAGTRETLAIVNVHSINFELVLDAFRAQIEALADVLAGHRGPIIFGGDFNTWNDARDAVLRETTARLGLTEVQLRVDRRAVFFGRHLDHLFVRGLELVEIGAIAVTSSDHNPIAATFRIP